VIVLQARLVFLIDVGEKAMDLGLPEPLF
jgi:hypothetical protein